MMLCLKVILKALIALAFGGWISAACAGQAVEEMSQNEDVKTNNCWIDASIRYGVDMHLLYAIAKTESNLNSRAISPANAIGVMQVHDSWLPKLQKMGISTRDLWEPCVNIMVGAWILANNIAKFGATWEAVGAYNASCTKLKGRACTRARQSYIRQVRSHLTAIEAQFRKGVT